MNPRLRDQSLSEEGPVRFRKAMKNTSLGFAGVAMEWLWNVVDIVARVD